jgi:hypothetical protein
MFQAIGGELRNAALRESNKVLGDAVNQLARKSPIPTIATVGAIQGGLQGGLQGAIRGAAQGVISAGLSQLQNQIPPQFAQAAAALQGIANPAAFTPDGWINPDQLAAGFTQAFGGQPGQRGTATTTYAGTTSADNPSTVRTQIVDATQGEVLTIKDSFLQGLQGGLSSIVGQGLNNLLGSLPSTMQNLLSSTGLTGALGSALGAIDGAIGKALGGLGNALGDAAGKLASGLGAAIGGIPGIGPAFEGFTKGIGNFTKNLNGAINGLPPELRNVVNGAAAQVGANLIGKALNRPKVVKDVGRQVANNIRFKENPVTQCNAIASAANACHKKTYATTGDKTFANVANAAKKAAKKFGTKLVKKKDLYGFTSKEIVNPQPVQRLVNGTLVSITTEANNLYEELLV